MNNDTYLYVIIALLPLTASMVVFQVNPYHALVIRGILGAIAAMIYAILGAADVALTEALVGTMLAITLYAVAVRSSLVMRLGLVKDELSADKDSLQAGTVRDFEQLMDELRTIFGKRHMRLELVTYKDTQTLHQALMEKEVHATCSRRSPVEQDEQNQVGYEDEKRPYHTLIGVRRIYDIIQAELWSPATSLTYMSIPDSGEKHT